MKTTLLSCITGLLILFTSFLQAAFGQVCSITLTTDTNFAAIPAASWTSDGVGGLTTQNCFDIANGNVTNITANFNVDISNGSGITLTIDKNVTINGNFDIPSGATGDNATISVTGGHTLTVTGNLGDATNNKINYVVPTASDHISVGLTLYGKNSNTFSGSGSISGTTLNLGNGGQCSTPCPVSHNFTNCIDGSGSTFCSDFSVPIVLSSFAALVSDQAVKLKWSTDSEINFDHFVLERSGNGKNFSELAKIKGSGFSNTRKEYSYLDQNPLIGNSYYRLTSVDFDNYTEVFNNSVVRVTVNAGKNFYIAPNPIEGLSLKAGINFDASNTYVVIYDRMGSVIGHYNASGSEFELQLPNLPNGVYFAQIQSEGFTKSVRFAVNQ